jgi:hypothetical protein
MRLLSKYKEPYDAMLATGVGDLTWIRKPTVSKLPDSLVSSVIMRSTQLGLNRDSTQGHEVHGYFLLGKKAYPFIAHAKKSSVPSLDDWNKLGVVPNYISDNWTFLFSLQECKRYCKENNLKGSTVLNKGTEWKALTLEDVNSPIGIVAWNSATSRPINHAVYVEDMCFSLLRRHNLWSQFSLVEVYQAAYMFLANKTTKENEVVTVENDTRIQQHGFDLKTSFRKSKGN